MPSYQWPPVGSHYVVLAGKHTTTADGSAPYENVVSIPGVLATDIVIPGVESLAPGGTPASGVLDIGGTSHDISVTGVTPGPDLNDFTMTFYAVVEDLGQAESWKVQFDIDHGATALLLLCTTNGSMPMTYSTLVSVLNAGVSGTYDGVDVVVVDTDSDLDEVTFSGGGSDEIAVGTEGTGMLDGGSTDSQVTFRSATPGADQITFTFAESLLAGHVISYIVFREV